MGLFGKKNKEPKPAQVPQKQGEKPPAHPVSVLPMASVQAKKQTPQEPKKPIDEDTARAAAQALREYLQEKNK